MRAHFYFNDFISKLSTIYNESEAENIARIVLEDAAGISNLSRLSGINPEIRDENIPVLNAILIRLMNHEPLQYILGEQFFFGMKFKVNPSVLIPRRETEELVQWIVKEHGRDLYPNILDIGTGSGCIPIALKKNIPSAQVFATDISEKAINTAKENAVAAGAEIEFAVSDILTLENPFHQPFDIIVSNPPYITVEEKDSMMKNVTEYEPHVALFVPENNSPLIFYEKIFQFALENLNNEGLLYFEINESFGNEVADLYRKFGFQQVMLRKDMQGKDRMIRGLLIPQWW